MKKQFFQFENVSKCMQTSPNNLRPCKTYFLKGKMNAHKLFSWFTCKGKSFILERTQN